MATIYVDVLLGLNLFVNFFLFLAVAKLTRYPLKKRRNLLASFLLSLTSLTILLPQMGWAAELLFRLSGAAFGVIIGFGFPGLKGFFRLLAALFSASFAFAGIMLGLWYLFHPAGLVINNGVVYLDVSPVLLVAATVVSYLILLLLRKNFGKAPVLTPFAGLHLQQGEQTLTLRAKLDTGFTLRDLYQDRPIIMLAPSAAACLFKNEELSYRLIPYETVQGTGLLRSGMCSRITAVYQDKTVTLTEVVVAVSEREFHEDYKALIGYDFIERMNLEHEKTQGTVIGVMDSAQQKTGRLYQRSGNLATAFKKRTGAGADGTSESRG